MSERISLSQNLLLFPNFLQNLCKFVNNFPKIFTFLDRKMSYKEHKSELTPSFSPKYFEKYFKIFLKFLKNYQIFSQVNLTLLYCLHFLRFS